MNLKSFLSAFFLIITVSWPLAAMNLGQNSSISHYGHGQSNNLPPQFDPKKIKHLHCDCVGLQEEGYSCGAYALTHAYQDHLDHLGRKLATGDTPMNAVKKAFSKLGYTTEAKRRISGNQGFVAESLGLDFTFLDLTDGKLRATRADRHINGVKAAWDELKRARSEILSSKRTLSKSFFAMHQLPENGAMVGHNAVITINGNKDGFVMHVVDNLKKPIAQDDPFYEFISLLYVHFFDISLVDWARMEFLSEFSSNNDGKENIDKYLKLPYGNGRVTFLNDVFNEALAKQKNSCLSHRNLTISPLNRGMKVLKMLARADILSGPGMVVRTYEAMLDIIQSGHGANQRELAEKVNAAIANTAQKEVDYFDLSILGALDRRAQRLVKKIRALQQDPQFAIEQAALELLIVLDRDNEIKNRREYLNEPNPAAQKDFLFALFDEWRVNQSAACQAGKIFTIKPLNEAIKPLKQLVKADKSSLPLLITAYDAMLKTIREAKASNVDRLELAKKVEGAIENSATQGLFDLADPEPSELMTRAQRMVEELEPQN